MLDINVVAETFYAEFLNIIFGWDLHNVNLMEPNAKSIDLVDENRKIIIQVSSDNSKKKVQKSLAGIDAIKYHGFHFYFVSICGDVKHLTAYSYAIPENITFDVASDCFSVETLVRTIHEKGAVCVEAISQYLDKTVSPIPSGKDVRPEAITYVINCLADVDLSGYDDSSMPKVFDFQPKIDKNKLDKWNDVIQTYAVFSNEVDKIYRQFDKESRNQSMAVLFRLKEMYLSLKKQYEADELFDKLKEEVYKVVDGDATCSKLLTKEQLELNISLVLVDAFMKCKIFEKPE